MGIIADKAKSSKYKSSGIQLKSSLNSFGNKFGESFDPNTSEGLYNLAMQHGGRTEEVLRELAHPQKSILSTIGNGLKNFGSGIINVLEAPNEIVGGLLQYMKGTNQMSLSDNVVKAVKEDISTSDVLFGEFNSKGKHGVEKVANFLVRTATDILLDPTTYLTFGATRGILGLSAAPRITAGSALAKHLGVKAGKGVALAEGVGDDFLKYVDDSIKGRDVVEQGASLVKRGVPHNILEGEVKKLTGDAVKLLDQKVIDFDVARKTMSDVLEVNPALAETLLDKGGVKYFGQTILEGEKIRAVRNLIPFNKVIDKKTLPMRNAVASLFDTSIRKIGSEYKRIPQEILAFQRQLRQAGKSKVTSQINKLVNVAREQGVKTPAEFNNTFRGIKFGDLPADPKARNLYLNYMDLKADNLLAIQSGGVSSTFLANRIPRLFGKNETSESILKNFQGVLNETVTTAKQKKNVAFEAFDGSERLLGEEGLHLTALNKVVDNIEEAVKLKGVTRESVEKSIEQQRKFLDTELDNFAKVDLDPEKSSAVMDVIRRQKDDLSTTLNNVFIDESTGKIFSRRGANLDETLQITGMKVQDIDWFETFAQEQIQVISQTTARDFTRDIANLGVKRSNAPASFRALNTQKNLVDEFGEEIVFNEDLAGRLENLMDVMTKGKTDTNAFLTAYDDLTSVWKSSVTSLFPAFHMRNAVSNVMLNFSDLGGHTFNPKYWIHSGNMVKKNSDYQKIVKELSGLTSESPKRAGLLKKQNELLSETFFTDARGHEWTFGELHETITKNDIAFTDIAVANKMDDIRREGRSASEILLGDSKIEKYTPVFRNFIGYKGGRKLGETIENQGRLLNFMTNLEKTGDVTLAATRTKQFLFDYQNLTEFERNVMRRIIPFYSFTRFNMEVQAKLLTSAPGRVNAQLTAADNFSKVFSQDDLTDEQKELLPSWMKRGFYSLKKNRDGTLKSVSVAEIPFEQPFDALSSRGILGSVSPIIRVPLEQLTGYDMYQGKVFTDVTNATAYKHAPRILKDFIGYDEVTFVDPKTGQKKEWSVSLRPSRMNLTNNLPPTSRIIGSIRQVESTDKSIAEKAMQQLFGFSFTDVDIEKVETLRERETLKNYTDILDNANIIYQFKRNIVSSN